MEKNNLTNEQVARIFAMYLGQKVRAYDSDLTLSVLHKSPSDFNEFSVGGAVENKFKLLLTPLSAISDEDAIEVSNLYGFHTDNPKVQGQALVHWLAKDGKSRDINFEIYQYLVLTGHAVPLFIEVGHPDNGKTAIELRIAIDKTTFQP
jgi:hypothetical protein